MFFALSVDNTGVFLNMYTVVATASEKEEGAGVDSNELLFCTLPIQGHEERLYFRAADGH